MKILLDTCTFLWIITNANNLSETAINSFSDPNNEIFLSVISEWEVMIKYSLGRLPIPGDIQQYLPQQRKKHRISSLPLYEDTVLSFVKLPDIHKDPFDRMLICQAKYHDLMILTPDKEIRKYPVKVIW